MTTQVGTFQIKTDRGYGFAAKDTCKFNNWGTQRGFKSAEEAADWARRADEFKRGKRMAV